MQKVTAVVATFVLVLAALAQAQGTRLPVFYLRYTGGVGFEELDDDDVGLEPSSVRHSVSLRIKEQFSRLLTGNLTLFYSTKDYAGSTADYSYFYLKPDLSVELSDRLTLDGQVRSKWVSYDEPALSPDSRDYLQVTGGIATTYEPVRGTRITASANSGFDLCDDEARSEQSYGMGLRVVSRLRNVTFGGSYRGTLYVPLGSASEQTTDLSSEFGVNLTWDPNK